MYSDRINMSLQFIWIESIEFQVEKNANLITIPRLHSLCSQAQGLSFTHYTVRMMMYNFKLLTCLMFVATNTIYTQQQPNRSTTRNKFISALQAKTNLLLKCFLWKAYENILRKLILAVWTFELFIKFLYKTSEFHCSQYFEWKEIYETNDKIHLDGQVNTYSFLTDCSFSCEAWAKAHHKNAI
jgi:hypothetical protein